MLFAAYNPRIERRIMAPERFVSTLLSWFSTHGRDLPWRHTRDPYAIWLSEIILQQTRISQGMDYWHRFMAAYPTVDRLAAASEDEVLKMWQGLGYYSRARNLHKAAQQVAAAGAFPTTIEGISKLKGVGSYTAAAIAAFAYDVPAAAVDGNFLRVLARVYGIDQPINSTQGRHTIEALAQEIVSAAPSAAAKVNAAMMDFGATQCTPKRPACEVCPMAEECEALRQGRVDELPVKLKTVKVKERRMVYVYLRCNGQTAIRQRGGGDIWQGLWELVEAEGCDEAAKDKPKQSAPALTDLAQWRSMGAKRLAAGVKHVLTHRIILADFYFLETPTRPDLPADYIWIDERDLENYAVPRLIEILLEKLPTC